MLLVVVSTLGGSSPEPPKLDNFLHLVPGTARRLPSNVQKTLSAAAEDFRAVQSGRTPLNAKLDVSRPLPADGGTTYWSGAGYQVTVVKALTTLGGVDDYMYGPILEFSSELIDGNASSMSSVSFYSFEELRTLLNEK
ncbi:MAG: hypothetical protein IPK00_24150 [Deltaproteobacteria bacterium]|nr:hypothetical protein [Deltaproteobacteria bacterium]